MNLSTNIFPFLKSTPTEIEEPLGSKFPLATVRLMACSRSSSACIASVLITGSENVRKSG